MYTKSKQWVVSFYAAGRWVADEPVLGRDFRHACKMAAYICNTVLRQHGIDSTKVSVSWQVHDTAACVDTGRDNSGAATVSLKRGV